MAQAVPKFPLFDKLKATPNTTLDINKLCATINGMDKEQCEIVFLLIYHYEMLHPTTSKVRKLPFGANYLSGTKIPLFNTDLLPLELKHILNNFIRL